MRPLTDECLRNICSSRECDSKQLDLRLVFNLHMLKVGEIFLNNDLYIYSLQQPTMQLCDVSENCNKE